MRPRAHVCAHAHTHVHACMCARTYVHVQTFDRETNLLRSHLRLMSSHGKAVGLDFIIHLICSVQKLIITGNLWSDSGMALFGIYVDGMTEDWQMKRFLIGLIACEEDHHTAENIKMWIKDALVDIGVEKLIKIATGRIGSRQQLVGGQPAAYLCCAAPSL